MSEKQKEILAKMADALPNMTEFEKGYLTCLVETRAGVNKKESDGEDDGRTENF
ncbi:MAG: hypothetical protein HFG49_07285 [Lachnospiraceae bacterium]|jgi:hypothetical protein|nr:hypothetical protein [Lachnospiraceae bacterium]